MKTSGVIIEEFPVDTSRKNMGTEVFFSLLTYVLEENSPKEGTLGFLYLTFLSNPPSEHFNEPSLFLTFFALIERRKMRLREIKYPSSVPIEENFSEEKEKFFAGVLKDSSLGWN